MRPSELPNSSAEVSLALVPQHSLDRFALMFSCSIILIESNQTHVARKRNQNKTQQATSRTSTMNLSMDQIRGRIKMLRSTTILLLVFLTKLLPEQTQPVNGSGVFELELIKLEPIESLSNRPQQQHHDNSSLVRANLTDTTREEQASGSGIGLVKVLVCLKEPFTSQLDGPCTFGNSSITLNRNSQNERQELASNVNASTNLNATTATLVANATSIRQDQHVSQMTNIVRILFTFRWTKAFTIILTAEELQIDATGTTTAGAAGIRLTTTTTSTTTTATPLTAAERSDLSSTNGSGGQATNGTARTKSGTIDRHILTENEVLPNLEPNPNKPWASRFSRSLKSSLAYRFRVYCSLNYYGDGCTTFCRPRDDQFGHYNCSSTGQKICHDGWHGSDCDRARCRAGCNQQYGFCQQPDTCQCRPGWTGPRCDECITYPGCQNGYCLSAWQCICQRNWGGVMCDQDLNFCGTHEPCRNNGTCQNIAPDRYKCNCPEGFTGSDCEISMSSLSMQQFGTGCALNPCLNGGTCYGFNTDSLLSDTTEGLEPSVDVNSYRCQCALGWTGDFCQWSDLPSNFLFDNTSAIEKSTTESPSATTMESNTLQTSIEHETVTLNSKALKSIIENAPSPSRSIPFSNMNYLISWVVGATILGVLLAFCMLAWCCFMAIKRNRFSFIQMNIIRNSDGSGQTALRRMHEKIRDSLRRSSRSRIKPETKLSIENVLKPPPSYDESNNYHALNKIAVECSPSKKKPIEDMGQGAIIKSNSHTLVIRGALEKKLSATPSIASSSKSSSTITSEKTEDNITKVPVISEAKLKCPRHGQLYRQQQYHHQRATNCNYAVNVNDYYHTSHLYHDPPPNQQSTSYH